MKIITTFILILSYSLNLNCQVSGYLGKRFSFSFDQNFGPNYLKLMGVTNFLSNESNITGFDANFNYKFKFNLDYVLANNLSIGTSISPIKNKIFFDDSKTTINPLNVDESSTYDFINNAKIYGLAYSANIKLFKRNWIAPLGEFYKFEFIYSKFKIDDFEKKTDIYNSTYSKLKPYNNYAFAITHGINHIYFNHLIISCGITLGTSFNLLENVEGYGNIFNAHEITLQRAVNYWYGQSFFYNLHTGIGFLIF